MNVVRVGNGTDQGDAVITTLNLWEKRESGERNEYRGREIRNLYQTSWKGENFFTPWDLHLRMCMAAADLHWVQYAI